MNSKHLFLYLLIGSVAVSAAVGIGVILFGDFGNFEVRVLMTTLTVTAASILGLACGAYLETGRGRTLPMFGIAVSIAAAIMTFFIIWDVMDESVLFVRSAVTAMLLAAASAHLSLLFLARLDRRFAWIRPTAFVCIGLLTAILLFLIWAEPETNTDTIGRIIAVLAILAAAVTVITPIFHKLSTDEVDIAKLDAEIEATRQRLSELESVRAKFDPVDTGSTPAS